MGNGIIPVGAVAIYWNNVELKDVDKDYKKDCAKEDDKDNNPKLGLVIAHDISNNVITPKGFRALKPNARENQYKI